MLRFIQRTAFAAAVVGTAATLTKTAPRPSSTSVWSCAQSACAAGWATFTSPLYKDIRKGDRGEARRLTFEERAERRMGKTREQKESREQLLQEAQTMVSEDFPEELESIYTKTSEKANISAMKVLNMAKCLELLEVEMAGGHNVLLTKVAQVVKVNNNTIEIVPNSPSFASAILQRVSRFDCGLQVSKEGTKIKVVMVPITTSRRDKTAAEISSLVAQFRQRVKESRTNAVKVLQDAGLEEGVVQELTDMVDSAANSFVEEKAVELELLAEEVMSMGIDESDVGSEAK
jgi:ribosome recycling factor